MTAIRSGASSFAGRGLLAPRRQFFDDLLSVYKEKAESFRAEFLFVCFALRRGQQAHSLAGKKTHRKWPNETALIRTHCGGS
jgi:hypothetical protein